MVTLTNQGVDLRTMQDYLGHRDPRHTVLYTRVAGRPRKVSGTEAERIGLVNRALPPDELMAFTRRYALDLAQSCSPRSLRVIKQQIAALPLQTMAQSFAEADRLMIESLASAEFKEGVAHFVEKRAPRFSGR